MFDRKQINDAMTSALKQYHQVCEKSSKPGLDGIMREGFFESMIDKSKSLSADEAVILMYDFYKMESKTSRLIQAIEHELLKLFKIETIPTIGVFSTLTFGINRLKIIMTLDNEIKYLRAMTEATGLVKRGP